MVGEVRSARGVDTIPLETIYMENRDLFIKSEITCEVADAFCEQFVYGISDRTGTDDGNCESVSGFVNACGICGRSVDE